MNFLGGKQINPDLQNERNKATFDVEEFAKWWYGSEEKLKFKRFLDSYILDDVDEDIFRTQHLRHDEIYTAGIKSCVKVSKKLRKLQDLLRPGQKDIWPGLYLSSNLWGALPPANPFSVHYSMIVDAIQKLGTAEQYEKFGKRAENLEIACAFAQTELGHGTYLRGLETRADYDPEREEFILNTPTMTSYKWWPGGLGQTANYCIVVAQLYIGNCHKDLALFMVQIRDEETHMPLPGIDIGDVGKKMGFPTVNNGYLGLKNVRVPRNHMLMRHDQVLPDGTYVKGPNTAVKFLPLLIGRCVANESSASLLAMACTIASRYSAVRRQCSVDADSQEVQILNYQTQQMKIFPEIGNAIAYKLTSKKLWQCYYETSRDIDEGNYDSLPELHALSCCLKVLSTSDVVNGVERLRLACGGHGYLSSANLGNMYVDGSAACTYEGDNTVLLLTVGRYLLKSYVKAIAGEEVPSLVAYLRNTVEDLASHKWTGTWENILRILEIVAANKIRLAFERIEKRLKSGQTEAEAFNNTGVELIKAAELHGRVIVASIFYEEVKGSSASFRSPQLNRVLENLFEIFLLNIILKKLSDIQRVITISEAEILDLEKRLETSLKTIRPDAVAICDGFDFHDRNMSSTLGCYDGNVYQRIFEAAKSNPLNAKPVPDVFHTHLKPFMKSKL